MLMVVDGVVSDLIASRVEEESGEEEMDVVGDAIDELFKVVEMLHGIDMMPDKAIKDIF